MKATSSRLSLLKHIGEAASNGCVFSSAEDLEFRLKLYTFEGKGSKMGSLSQAAGFWMYVCVQLYIT